MTLNDEFFKYITVKGDTYVLNKNVSDEIKKQIEDYIYDVKQVYKQHVEIEGDDILDAKGNEYRSKKRSH